MTSNTKLHPMSEFSVSSRSQRHDKDLNVRSNAAWSVVTIKNMHFGELRALLGLSITENPELSIAESPAGSIYY